MNLSSLLGPLLALISALVWGSADFSGGRATRRINPYQVLVLAGVSGGATLLLLTLLWREPLPVGWDFFWAVGAGLCGAFGLAALYRGLSSGNAALVAPVAAVVGASAPVVFELFRSQPPTILQWLGFGLALLGIWLVSQTEPAFHHLRRAGLAYGFVAGVGFGGFFILIGLVSPGHIFAPLLVCRMTTLVLALILVTLRRDPLPVPQHNPIALLAGVLDAGGNLFYLLAAQYTRLDVAAVLSSLYPAVTVVLAARLTHEHLTRGQWLGLAACMGAVVLVIL